MAIGRLGTGIVRRARTGHEPRGASVALLLTALRDEAKRLAHFGEACAEYMGTSKRFVPFVV